MVLNERWLRQDISSQVIVDSESCHMFRKDGEEIHKGGARIAVRGNIPTREP